MYQGFQHDKNSKRENVLERLTSDWPFGDHVTRSSFRSRNSPCGKLTSRLWSQMIEPYKRAMCSCGI